MHAHFKLIFIIALIFSISKNIVGKNYYVDKYASGENNGTSWENAWNFFNEIEWSKLNPGDVLFISGGKDSTVYYETLTIGISGNENQLITVRNGLEPGHNGRVIIDVPFRGMNISNKKYIRIANLEFKNVTSGVYIRGNKTGDVNVIYLDSLRVLNFNRQGGIFINGWSSDRSDATIDSVFIRFCTLETSYQTDRQTDVIYAQYCNNLFILNNDLTVNSKIKGPHTDVIQFVHNIKNITIANNNITNLTSSANNNKSNGIMGADLEGQGLFFNNIVYAPNFKSSSNNVFFYSNGTTPDKDGTWEIYNNIFIGGGTVKLFSIEDKDARIKNNIFYSIPNGTGLVFIKAPLDDWSGLDYNLYGQNNGIKEDLLFNFEGGKTMRQMNNLGAELNGIEKMDPLFRILFNDLHLNHKSPALNSGINLGSPFNRDKNGVERPANGSWDIGCYQHTK
jgi:hypothetical protein